MDRQVQKSITFEKKFEELGFNRNSTWGTGSWYNHVLLQLQQNKTSINTKRNSLYCTSEKLRLVQKKSQGSVQSTKKSFTNVSQQDVGSDVRIAHESHWQILIVGDVSSNLAIQNHLALQPYQIQCVNSDHDALKHIRQQAPNLILYNVVPPNLDGVKFYHELNGANGMDDSPTIFLVEKKHLSGLIDKVEYGSIDYLIKPFDKHELISAIQGQLAIVSTRNRLSRLRAFSSHVARVKDIDTLLNRTFNFLQEEPCLTDVTLFKGGNLVCSNSAEISHIETVFDQVESSATRDNCYILNQDGYFSLYLKLPDVQEWTFIIRIENKLASGVEIEYIQNVFHQACTIKENIQATLCDSGTITNLYTIISKKEQILFIKSARQYVELYAKRHRPELLTISLSTVSLYMKDHLLKVHRSYMINPNEVQHVRRKKRGRYEILMSEYVIPVGEVFLPVLREKYSHWFKNPILRR